MPGPIRNNQSNQVDPYNNPDDWLNQDLDNTKNYSPENQTFMSDASAYIDGQEESEGTPLSVTDTLQSLQDTAKQLRSQIHDKATDPAEKKQLIQVLQKTMDLIHKLGSLKNKHVEEVPANLEQQINDVELAAAPADNTDGTNATGDGNDNANADMKTRLQDLKSKIQTNDNLTPDKKTAYTQKIDRWLSQLDLNNFDVSNISNDVDSLEQEFTTASQYTTSVQSFAEATGKTPEEIMGLFEKYGIDPKHVPNPPDDRVAKLLNDSSFEDIQSLTADVKAKYDDLKKGIADAVDAAQKDADKRHSGDTSTDQGMDFSMYEKVQKMYEHKDDTTKALGDARTALANKTAEMLSALYGTDVKASTDETKPGIITVNGAEINVCADSHDGSIKFSQGASIDWPPVNRPQAWVDCEGSGVTGAPPWMESAGYPVDSYDGDLQYKVSA